MLTTIHSTQETPFLAAAWQVGTELFTASGPQDCLPQWKPDNDWVSLGVAPPTGQRVAVVGSGPAGLACAAYLAARGHRVTVFPATPAPLPADISAAVQARLESMGVEFCGNVAGTHLTADHLLDTRGYDAVYSGDVAATRPGVFAAGGAATDSVGMTLAIGAGHQAARAIHAYLHGQQ